MIYCKHIKEKRHYSKEKEYKILRYEGKNISYKSIKINQNRYEYNEIYCNIILDVYHEFTVYLSGGSNK